ncbi:MAG TPA: IS110 family transposase [Micromonosporaceae bacterium]|nr:IS110 family transposase [Micromonosporaceae bacterium]
MSYLYVGVDIGKQHHHIAVVNERGTQVTSQQVPNDQARLQAMIKQICHRRRNVRWAVDIISGPAALLVTLLHARHLDVRYVNGYLFAHIAPAFNGEHKTDAADAVVIAQTLRTRDDLPVIAPHDPARDHLLVLTEHRRDLVEQRVRTIMRMQAVLTSISPALGQVLDLSLRGPVHILTQWQTPTAIRKAGYDQIHALLKQYKVNNAKPLAAAVIAAARAQTIRTAGEAAYAAVLGQLATDLRDLTWRIEAVDAQIADALASHPLAEIVLSMPGMGTILSAEFLAHTGTDTHPTPSRLAAHAGFAPVNRDSGSVTGNLKRPHRFHRVLRRVFLMSALTALKSHPESTAYYRRKRAEGMTHRQAIGALGRRRITVLWTMIQNRKPYHARTVAAT